MFWKNEIADFKGSVVSRVSSPTSARAKRVFDRRKKVCLAVPASNRIIRRQSPDQPLDVL